MSATLRDEIKSFRVRLGSALFAGVPKPARPECANLYRCVLELAPAAEKKANLRKLDGSLWD